MKVWLVGAGPGDPGLLTIRGRECLERADVIVYDALANPAFLDCAKADAEKIYVGKIAERHALPQDEINTLLAKKAREGKNVLRLKGGDPYIFGRGGEEASYLYDLGIPFEEVPGISSAVAAPAYAGIPLTDRRAASAVSIITGHESDLNRGSHNWQAYAASGATLVFVMGMRNLANICQNLMEAGMAATTPAAVVHKGCTASQRAIVGTLSDLPKKVTDAGIANPAVIVVGKCVSLRDKLDWYERLPLFGRRVVVTRASSQAGGMAAALAALGAEVVEYPVIRIEPMRDYAAIDKAIAGLGGYDWLIFTSANGVRCFFTRLEAKGLDSRAFGKSKIAAIGPGTSGELRKHGLLADLVPHIYVAEALAEALGKASELSGSRILLARAEEARDALPEALANYGATVDVLPVYKTLANDPGFKLDMAKIDCISFTSSSTVRNFLALNGSLANGDHPAIAAIGPITGDTLEEAGIKPCIMPEKYTVPALVAAIGDYFKESK